MKGKAYRLTFFCKNSVKEFAPSFLLFFSISAQIDNMLLLPISEIALNIGKQSGLSWRKLLSNDAESQLSQSGEPLGQMPETVGIFRRAYL